MKLNTEQAQAVSHYNGPCIVTAVPGSGKTRVLTSRVVNLIKNKGIAPRNILCLTFTNKAANEMKDRIVDEIDHMGKPVWVSTFHRLCLAVLRKHGHIIDLPANFTVYTDKDQEELMKKAARMNEYDDLSQRSIRYLLNKVNDFREDIVDFKQHVQELDPVQAAIVNEYLEILDEMKAVDFSGMLYKAWLILKNNPAVVNSMSERFKYVLVDEMQDTNRIQYDIVRRIASHGNLFVVGDVQQSVYGWRGARPENINEIRSDFEGVSEVVLPRNYRSTAEILRAAENLIRNNDDAADVELISDRGSGAKIFTQHCKNAEDEALLVVQRMIGIKQQCDCQWSDFAVLYRMNSLSSAFEFALRQMDIPYKLVGGFSFFDRTEVKTTFAYLNLINNPSDTISFERAVGTPSRQIGPKLIGKLEKIVRTTGKSIIDICLHLDDHDIPKLTKVSRENVMQFGKQMQEHIIMLSNKPLVDVARSLIEKSGYFAYLVSEADKENKKGQGDKKCQDRVENVESILEEQMPSFVEENPQAELSDYLQSVQLFSDHQQQADDEDAISLMTMHSAKGLEWPCVFIVGAEDHIIPHYRTKDSEEGEKEERRLMYVAITRAQDYLSLTHCYHRRGRPAQRSRFLDEMVIG